MIPRVPKNQAFTGSTEQIRVHFQAWNFRNRVFPIPPSFLSFQISFPNSLPKFPLVLSQGPGAIEPMVPQNRKLSFTTRIFEFFPHRGANIPEVYRSFNTITVSRPLAPPVGLWLLLPVKFFVSWGFSGPVNFRWPLGVFSVPAWVRVI